MSDSTKKEKFVKSDAEEFLQKLSHLRLGSWNYKEQNAVAYRHYGPMAQEIYAAFGKDKYGTIGCDTLLATADMDGIMMIALQGLEKRTTDQKQENAQLKIQLNKINENLAALKKENTELKTQLAKLDILQEQLIALQKQVKKDTKVTEVYNASYKQTAKKAKKEFVKL